MGYQSSFVAISGEVAARLGAVSGEASTIAPYMDALYFFLLAMTVVGAAPGGRVLVFGFSIRYRQGEASGGDADRRLDAA